MCRKDSAGKNILIVNSTLHVGGAEEMSATLCRNIDRDLFNIGVCCLKENGVIGKKIASEGTDVTCLRRNKWLKTDYLTFVQLRTHIRNNNINIIHSHDVHALADSAMCRLVMPSVRFAHTFHYGNYPSRSKDVARIERTLWRIPDVLVAVSAQQKAGLCELYGIPADRIKVVWNGVDQVNPGEPLECIEKYRKDGCVLVGCINTLIEQKGMDYLLEVVQLLKDRTRAKFKLLVAGDGHLRKQLEDHAKEMELEDNLEFLGWINNASLSLMPYIDIFFQPSRWEAMSMVLLEAMAAGKAIVATSVGETPRIINHSQDGLLVKSGDVNEMAQALGRLINNRELRELYGANAMGRYKEHFTGKHMARRYETLYQEMIE